MYLQAREQGSLLHLRLPTCLSQLNPKHPKQKPQHWSKTDEASLVAVVSSKPHVSPSHILHFRKPLKSLALPGHAHTPSFTPNSSLASHQFMFVSNQFIGSRTIHESYPPKTMLVRITIIVPYILFCRVACP